MSVLAEEMQRRHAIGYPQRDRDCCVLPNPGDFHWRRHGDTHMDPNLWPVSKPPRAPAAKTPTGLCKVNDDNTRKATLRGLLALITQQAASPSTR